MNEVGLEVGGCSVIQVYAWRIYVFSCSSILNSVRYYPFGGGVHVLKEGVSMYENGGCPCMTLGVSFYEDPFSSWLRQVWPIVFNYNGLGEEDNVPV